MYPDTLPIYVSHQDNIIIIIVVEMKHKLIGVSRQQSHLAWTIASLIVFGSSES